MGYYLEEFNIMKNGDYSKYLNSKKKTLLINGYDLKFIKPYVSILEKDFNVIIDEWTGHNQHDEKKSLELLDTII